MAIATGFVAASVLGALGVPETVTSYFNTVPLVALPIAVGIALLRHRLYEIDTVIDRALVAAGLAAFATVVFVALVVAVGGLVGSTVATAIVAVSLQPLHTRLRRGSARLVYGRAPSDPAIVVRTLGGFVVIRDGEPLPASAWQSKKARTLLKILIARRGRPVAARRADGAAVAGRGSREALEPPVGRAGDAAQRARAGGARAAPRAPWP